MVTVARQMSQSQSAKRDQEICEKSVELRAYSSALLGEARDLCYESRRLRAKNALIAATNPNPNAAKKRESIQALALRFSSRPQISVLIECSTLPLRADAQVFDRRKLADDIS